MDKNVFTKRINLISDKILKLLHEFEANELSELIIGAICRREATLRRQRLEGPLNGSDANELESIENLLCLIDISYVIDWAESGSNGEIRLLTPKESNPFYNNKKSKHEN